MESLNKRMLSKVNSECYYPIKRSFGQTLQNCDIQSLIAYTKISDNKDKFEQNIEFLIIGLCYNIIKPNQIRDKYIRFEELLKRLNRPKEVEDFLQLRYDENGYFSKRFYILAKKAISTLQPNEQVDYIQLFKDFKYWNRNNHAQMRWAMKIAKIEDENKEENEE